METDCFVNTLTIIISICLSILLCASIPSSNFHLSKPTGLSSAYKIEIQSGNPLLLDEKGKEFEMFVYLQDNLTLILLNIQ